MSDNAPGRLSLLLSLLFVWTIVDNKEQYFGQTGAKWEQIQLQLNLRIENAQKCLNLLWEVSITNLSKSLVKDIDCNEYVLYNFIFI